MIPATVLTPSLRQAGRMIGIYAIQGAVLGTAFSAFALSFHGARFVTEAAANAAVRGVRQGLTALTRRNPAVKVVMVRTAPDAS